MYRGCSGAASIYACCISFKVCTSGKIFILTLDLSIRESKSTWGNGIRPSLKDCIG
jgi:hypothetical protein